MDSSYSHNNRPFLWVIILLLLLICVHTCKAAEKETARYDTIPARVECVVKFVEKTHTTAKGNTTTRYYAVYADKQLGINDIIPLSEAVFTYVHECSDFGVAPQLGIKLKNGEIYSLIRIRKKIKHGY